MTQYLLAPTWERNGYHDSDWYGTFYDSQMDDIVTLEIGTTRGANALPPSDDSWPKPDEATWYKAERAFAWRIFGMLKWQEEQDVEVPYPIENGTRVRLLRNVRNKKGKDDAGKIIWETFEAGLAGTVFRSDVYGTFYRNGYNQPGRFNTTVQFKLDDGRTVKAKAEALRLDREPPSDFALLKKARAIAKRRQFNRLATGSRAVSGGF